MRRSTVILVTSLASLVGPWACVGGEPEPDAGAASGSDGSSWDAGPDAGSVDAAVLWTARVRTATPLLAPMGDGGCLVATDASFAAGTQVQLIAESAAFALVDEAGSVVAAADLDELSRPNPFPPGRSGMVMYNFGATSEYDYGPDGCPVPIGSLADLTPVEALARNYDLNYRGNVVIDRQLHLAPVREIDADGWTYPWHAGVQIVQPFDGGFVVGAGVVIGPNAILTAKHMGVDPTYCYAREAASGPAWAAGKFVCDNIAGPALIDPTGVDAATVSLIRSIPPPYAKVRRSNVQVGEDFFTSRWGTNSRNVFSDGTVLGVDNSNAWCQNWPANSSFWSLPIVAGGDSGGPAWIGDELVGIVHGQRCGLPWDPERHVFVDVPSLLDFIAAELPDGGT